jgi:hypothetical protein
MYNGLIRTINERKVQMPKSDLKVGQIVFVKYDVEQDGKIVKIESDWIHVQVAEGGYVHADCSDPDECYCGRTEIVQFRRNEIMGV